jgi:hypothetical protein
MDAGVAGKPGPTWGEDKRWAAVAIEIETKTTIHAALSFLMAHACLDISVQKGD